MPTSVPAHPPEIKRELRSQVDERVDRALHAQACAAALFAAIDLAQHARLPQLDALFRLYGEIEHVRLALLDPHDECQPRTGSESAPSSRPHI